MDQHPTIVFFELKASVEIKIGIIFGFHALIIYALR